MNTAFKSKFLLVVSVLLLTSGCQSNQNVKIDPTLNTNNAALVYLHRPSSDFAGLAIDYRVSANATALGSLGTGDTLKSFVTPGNTVVKVQPYFLGFADGKAVTMELTLSEGNSYFIQFNQKLNYIAPTETHTITSGSLVLTQLKESEFKGKK